MKITVFSAKSWDREYLPKANQDKHELKFVPSRLDVDHAELAKGSEAVCLFVNDDGGKESLGALNKLGIKLVLMRCAGFNNVDLEEAKSLGMQVMTVPGYSPYAVAEHAVALILSLNRKIHKSYNRVRENNFELTGLLGFDIHGKTVGVLGTGKIGQVFAGIMKGFGVKLIGYDKFKSDQLVKDTGLEYVELDELFAQSDIISVHLPLLKDTKYIINNKAIEKMKKGNVSTSASHLTSPDVMIVNTSRGALIDTKAVIAGLKKGQIGHLGLDVYEEEESLFYEDNSGKVLQDDTFARLLTFPNVLITGHQAFFTREAQENICSTTMQNAEDFLSGKKTDNAKC
ncbi:D-lactate dehydrogenase [Planoprotostelium fungivorum]|uniref:D-lactate dehydrogenase n=1 Tax=Planoprotostelium fungivorum TaxID=1890364 RepID=A0A2P6MRI1_9EUKA|nr:D-lactate dehydrogenase [Planoprotostelium fungivorum]